MARPADLSASAGAGRRTRLALTVGGGATTGSGLARSRYRAAQLEASAARLRPRTVGQILDAACELFAARFAPLFAVGFCLWLVALFLQATTIRYGGELALMVSHTAVAAVVQVLCAGFACVLVAAPIQGLTLSAGDAFLTALVRVPGLLLFSIVAGLSQILLLCCIAPGVVTSWLFAVVPAVYVIERCNVLRAVGRGISLVSTGEAFLRWMGYALLGFVMTLPFQSLQAGLSVPGAHEGLRDALALSGPSLDFVLAALGAPYLAVATAFLAVVQAVFYFDLRVRREGFDLERRLDALEAAAGGAE